MKDVSRLIVTDALTLRDALRRLDDAGQGVLLLVDSLGRLKRTVTDGDIRRLLLDGTELRASLAALPSLQPKTVTEQTSSSDALAMMNEFMIDHLPVVGTDGRPCALLHRRELDSQILLSTPHLSEYEREFVEEAFRTNWIAPVGPNVDAFERELADYVGAAHACAVSSGTAAIHLALRILDIRQGDRVACSTFTFVASANPILYQGATPIFVDSEPSTWNMSPSALADALSASAAQGTLPKAVIVVNLYGQSADFDTILGICDEYKIPVIEDAAESLGATYKGRASGTIGALGIFSFNGNKIITTSGGGMLVSEDRALIDRARMLSTQARDPAPYYQHSEVGYNYRMSNILAGIGRGQLRVLDARIEARRAVFECYQKELSKYSAITWMPEAPFGRSTRWLSALVLDPEQTRITPATMIRHLADQGIEARHVWKPMHLQPLYAGAPYFPHQAGNSVSEDLFATGVCLPSGSNLSMEQQHRVTMSIDELMKGER